MSTVVRVQIQQRVDTASNWQSSNPTLLAGEVGHESDTRKYKLGDGSTAWNSLAYAGYSHPNHTGEVTSTGDGATVITDDTVDEANLKISNAGSNGQFLSKQSGDTGGLTWATPPDTNTTYTAGTGLTLSGTQFSVNAVALTTVQEASSESAQLALTTQEGDVVVRTDENKSYVKNAGSAGSMADFTLLRTPTDAVLSVAGHTGAVTSAQLSAAIDDNVIDEANLKISNAGTNGQYLQKQSGNTGGLTWSDVATGGGNTFEATASGAIGNAKPIKINTNGSVSEIKNIKTPHSSPVISPSTTTSHVGQQINSDAPRYQAPIWCSTYKVFAALYVRNTNGNIRAHIITPGADGSDSPAVGSSVDLLTNNNCWGIGSDFDPVNNQILTLFNNNAGSGSVRYHRTEVTNATTLTPKVHNTTETSTTSSYELEGYATGQSDQYTPSVRYIGSGAFATCWHVGQGPSGAPGDRDSLKVGIFEWGGSNYSNTVASQLTSENEPGTYYDIAKISDGKFIVIWKGDDNKGHYRIGNYDTSSNSLTLGTAGKFADYTLASVGNPSVAYDETAGKVLFVWQKDSDNDRYYSAVGTISGNDISVGSEVLLDTSSGQTPGNTLHGQILNNLLYIPANEKISFTGTINPAVGSVNTHVKTKEATISGTSVSWSTGYTIKTTGLLWRRLKSAASDLDEGTLLHHYWDNDYQYNHCKQVTYNTVASNLTTDQQYVGFSDAAYNDGATATIRTVGNNVSNLSGLTAGNEYYIQANGTLNTTAGAVKTYAGTALTSSKLLIQPRVTESTIGKWVTINSGSIPNNTSEQIISEDLSDTYKLYKVQFYVEMAGNGNTIGLRVKSGGTWQTSNYWYQSFRGHSTTEEANKSNTSQNRIWFGYANGLRVASGTIRFGNVASTTQTKVFQMNIATNNNLTTGSTTPYVDFTSGGWNSTNVITGLKFQSSNMTNGWFVIEGMQF